MTRILAALVAVLILVAAALGFALRGSRSDLAEANAKVTTLTAEVDTRRALVAAAESAARVRSAEQAKADKQTKKERHVLDTAIARSSAWADEPVPADVAAALGVQLRPKD